MGTDLEEDHLPYRVIKFAAESMQDGRSLLQPGDIAALKRMDSGNPHPVFWRVMAQIGKNGEAVDDMPVWTERNLAFTLKCMATMAPFHVGADHPGKALKKAGYSSSSDIRINRLLRADGQPFHDYLLSTCRYMRSRQAGWDWYAFYRLASSRPEHRSRATFARSFYL